MDLLTGRLTVRARRGGRLAAALATLAISASAPAPAEGTTNWTVALGGGSKGLATARTLSAPTAVTASCSGLGTPIAVSWTAVANAGTYQVYRSAGGGAYTLAATVSAPTTTWSYSPPALLQTYAFKVGVTIGTHWTSGLSGPSATRTVTALLLCS